MLDSNRSSPIFNRWLAASLCAFAIGVVFRLAIKPATPPPVPENLRYGWVVSGLAHYLFHPLTGAAIVALFIFGIVKRRFSGLWSVVLSFMVGGMLTTILLGLL
jgi:hypothetical protein